MSKMRVFLIAGHDTATDPGAPGVDGYLEAELALKQRNRIAAILRARGATVFTEPDEAGLNATINWLNTNATHDDLVVDLHFNAAGPTATGTEVYRHWDCSEYWENQCRILSVEIAASLGIVNRGQKSEKLTRHTLLGILHTNGGREVLIETCFITNREDVQKYLQHMAACDEAIAAWILRQVAADNARDETLPR